MKKSNLWRTVSGCISIFGYSGKLVGKNIADL